MEEDAVLPNGILGIAAKGAGDVARFLHAHQRRCSDGQEIRTESLASGTVLLGGIITAASESVTRLSRDAERGACGVFSGVAFDDWGVERDPHTLLALSAGEIDSGANGMFLACAAEEEQLVLITDPWGTMPLYIHESRDVFAFSTSLLALTEAMSAGSTVRNREAESQLLVFGTTFDGQTLSPNIRKLGRARVCRVRRMQDSTAVSEEEYFTPVVQPSEYRGIDDDIVDSFRSAVRKLHRKAEGNMICTLSGGLDSRVVAAAVAAEGLDLPFATHAVRAGHDQRIARLVASRLNLRHHLVALPSALPLDARADRFLSASNGAIAFDNYHVMWAFPQYATLGRYVMDGVHTSIEGRWFLRNNSRKARSRDAFFRAAFQALLRPDFLRFVPDADEHLRVAGECLRNVIPDPAEYASPGACADVFNVRIVLPNHGADASLLQNNFLRYVSPYLDREYVSVIARVTERKRWGQYPQRLIIRKLAPELLGLPRSYSDILTWPTDNPYLLRLPVAIERAKGMLFRKRWPALHARLSRRAASLGYDLIWSGKAFSEGRLSGNFDLPAECAVPGAADSTVHASLLPMLHLLLASS